MKDLSFTLLLALGACQPAQPGSPAPSSPPAPLESAPPADAHVAATPPPGCANAIFSDVTEPGNLVQLDEHHTLRITWSGALDDDPHLDLLASIENSCSGWGECEALAYRGCGYSYFQPVYGPEYAVSLEPGPRDASGFLTLRKTERWGDAAQPEVRIVTLHYGSQGYVEAP